jgi:hypothetical protein
MFKKDAVATGVDRIARTWLASVDRQGVTLPTGSVMVAVPPNVGLLNRPSSGSLTGQAMALLHVLGSAYDEESTSASAGYRQDQRVFWSFIGHDANRLHEPWVKDRIVDRIVANDQVFNQELMRRSALSQSERWANRRWVLGRVGEFLYQGMSFYGIWELSEDEWGKRQRRETRRREFEKAKGFFAPQVGSLASQYLQASIPPTGPSMGIRHVMQVAI